MDVAHAGKQVVLDLILQARADQGAEEARAKIHGAEGLQQVMVRAPLITPDASGLGREMARREDREHRVADQPYSYHVKDQNVRDRKEEARPGHPRREVEY